MLLYSNSFTYMKICLWCCSTYEVMHVHTQVYVYVQGVHRTHRHICTYGYTHRNRHTHTWLHSNNQLIVSYYSYCSVKATSNFSSHLLKLVGSLFEQFYVMKYKPTIKCYRCQYKYAEVTAGSRFLDGQTSTLLLCNNIF